MAGGATVATLDEWTGAAVILAGHHPFHGGLTRIEEGDFALWHVAPVHADAGCCTWCRGSYCGAGSSSSGQCGGNSCVNTFLFSLLGGDFCLSLFLLCCLGGFRFLSFLGFNPCQSVQVHLGYFSDIFRVWCFQGFQFLVAQLVAYVLMGDTFMAVDTGLTCLESVQVLFTCSGPLVLGIH